MDIQKEREAFELAYIESRKDCPLAKSDILELLDGSYLVSRVDDSWNMWQAAKARAVPDGFILVPRDATDEMISHGVNALDRKRTARSCWNAMVEAAKHGE